MSEQDLSLVSIEDLIKELKSRTTCLILAYDPLKALDLKMQFEFGHGMWADAVKLGNILNNDILNNWRGELDTLHRIHEEKGNDDVQPE